MHIIIFLKIIDLICEKKTLVTTLPHNAMNILVSKLIKYNNLYIDLTMSVFFSNDFQCRKDLARQLSYIIQIKRITKHHILYKKKNIQSRLEMDDGVGK